MSRRPQPTRARPYGSTRGNARMNREQRLARFKRHHLSPHPRVAKQAK